MSSMEIHNSVSTKELQHAKVYLFAQQATYIK